MASLFAGSASGADDTNTLVVTAGRFSVAFVREMEPIEEVDDLPACKPGAFGGVVPLVEANWTEQEPRLTRLITVERVRGLCKWFRRTLDSDYRQVAPLLGVRFEPRSLSQDEKTLTLEGTVEKLPSHSPLVTRWLKVYVVCDARTGAIRRTIVTIRGEVQE